MIWKFIFSTSDKRAARVDRSLNLLHTQGVVTMNAITDFAAAQSGFNTKVVEALDAIVTGVAALKAQIAAMQSAPVTLSPEDQAVLDGVATASQALVDRAQAVAGSVTP